MSKKSIKLNYFYNVSYQILLLITPLITTPYISRVLGAEGIGTASFAESLVSYFTLFSSLGTAVLGQREISYLQEDVQKRSEIFWDIVLLRTISTSICAFMYVAFLLVYQHNFTLYLILMLNIFAVMVDISWYFQGLEEFGKIVGRNVVFKVVNIVYIFVFVKTRDDVLIYVAGLVGILFASNISLWMYLPKMVNKVTISSLNPKRYLKESISLFIPTVAIQVYTVLDKTMIGIFSETSEENGYYEQAIRISKMILTIVTSLGTVMIPRIGYYLGKNDVKQVKQYMYRGYRFVWFLGIPLCLGLFGVSDNIVKWLFGTEYK